MAAAACWGEPIHCSPLCPKAPRPAFQHLARPPSVPRRPTEDVKTAVITPRSARVQAVRGGAVTVIAGTVPGVIDATGPRCGSATAIVMVRRRRRRPGDSTKRSVKKTRVCSYQTYSVGLSAHYPLRQRLMVCRPLHSSVPYSFTNLFAFRPCLPY